MGLTVDWRLLQRAWDVVWVVQQGMVAEYLEVLTKQVYDQRQELSTQDRLWLQNVVGLCEDRLARLGY